MDRHLAQLTRRKREKTYIDNIKNERSNKIRDSTDSKWGWEILVTAFFANKFNNISETNSLKDTNDLSLIKKK